jgi:hypothetical protein
MKVVTKSLWLVALIFSTSFTIGQIFPQQSGGGESPATNILSLVPHAGLLRIDYDFFTAPDTLDVYYENINIFSSGWLQYSGQFNIPYGPGNSTNLVIVMNQNGNPFPPTVWQYTPAVLQPVPLSIAVNTTGQITLTWPYSSDTFTLESCSDLNAPQWQPATDLSITFSNGVYDATGPITAANQFFRLRPN